MRLELAGDPYRKAGQQNAHGEIDQVMPAAGDRADQNKGEDRKMRARKTLSRLLADERKMR